MEKITVSAPGKLHLIGEHSSVYGEPAILAAINKRVFVTLEKSKNVSYIDERFEKKGVEWDLDDVKKTTQKIKELWYECKKKNDFSELFEEIKKDRWAGFRKSMIGIVIEKMNIDSGVSVKINSNMPVGSGFGSSAALSACIAMGIPYLNGKKIKLEEINETAFELEKLVHGNPSGGDNSICTLGGFIWFEKGTPNKILSLKKEIPYTIKNFIAVYTKDRDKATGELVQHIRNLEEEYRTPRIKTLSKAAYEMKDALKSKNFSKVKDLIKLSQNNLKELGVSCKEIDDLCKEIEKIGGAAKISGAGGGGIVLCYHENLNELKDKIKSLGYEPMEIELGSEGVRIEK